MVKRFNLYREGNFHIHSDLKARWLGPRDLKFIETKKNTFWKFIGEMIEGSRCLGLINDGEVLSYLWINDKYMEYYGMKIALKPNECFIYNANTKPDRRGNGYAEILRSKCYELIDKDTFYSFSDLNNKPAIRFKEKINADMIDSYLFIKFWKFKYLRKCGQQKKSCRSFGKMQMVK